MIMGFVRDTAKRILGLVGLDIIRNVNNPKRTLLGVGTMPIRTIIDVGANSGQFAKNILEHFPGATVYCFEPLPEPFSHLTNWAKTTGGKVITCNLALGNEEKQVEMFLHENHTPSSSLLETTKLTEEYYPFTRGQKKIMVRQTTLDNAFVEMKADLFSDILIKLDVQGYEDRVISGASETFAKASACILEISLDTLYKGQASFKDLITKLDSLGYQYAGNLEQVYRKDGHCIYIDAVFLNKKFTL